MREGGFAGVSMTIRDGKWYPPTPAAPSDWRPPRFSWSRFALSLARNLIPAAGVLLLHWSLQPMLLLGGFNIVLPLMCTAPTHYAVPRLFQAEPTRIRLHALAWGFVSVLLAWTLVAIVAWWAWLDTPGAGVWPTLIAPDHALAAAMLGVTVAGLLWYMGAFRQAVREGVSPSTKEPPSAIEALFALGLTAAIAVAILGLVIAPWPADAEIVFGLAMVTVFSLLLDVLSGGTQVTQAAPKR